MASSRPNSIASRDCRVVIGEAYSYASRAEAMRPSEERDSLNRNGICEYVKRQRSVLKSKGLPGVPNKLSWLVKRKDCEVKEYR